MLGGRGRRGVAITCPESIEVWGGAVEAISKVFGSLDSNRLFGMVEDETKSSIDEEVAPFGLERASGRRVKMSALFS